MWITKREFKISQRYSASMRNGIENFNKEIENIKKNFGAEGCKNWNENFSSRLDSRTDEAKEKVNELEEMPLEITQSKEPN